MAGASTGYVFVAAAALGLAAYYLVRGEVPIVVLYSSLGRITRAGHPLAFWAFVTSHVLVATLALWAAKRRG